MERLSDGLEERLRAAVSEWKPARTFVGYRVLQTEPMVVVRVFSQAEGRSPIWPVPYTIFAFDPETSELRKLTGPEAKPYEIPRPLYK